MALTPSNQMWLNRETLEGEGAIGNLLQEIPQFEDLPFRIGNRSNEYLRLIARKPLDSDSLREREHVPVAAVSKEYRLVQHHEVVNSVLKALEKFAVEGKFVTNPQFLDAKLRLSKYGARMWSTILLPNCEFDPGDGYPIFLTLNCFNSVDRSVAVRIQIAWHRGVSDTKMMGRQLRRIHERSFKTEEIEEFLKYQFKRLLAEQNLYKQWSKTKVNWIPVVNWLNQKVAKKWGAHTAVRAYHIIETGCDIEIKRVYIAKREDGDKEEEVKLGQGPLQLEKFDFITNNRFDGSVPDDILDDVRARFIEFGIIREVPGLFIPVDNVYHISQVLSWLASQRETVEGQLTRLNQIPALMDALLRQEPLPPRLTLGREYKKSR